MFVKLFSLLKNLFTVQVKVTLNVTWLFKGPLAGPLVSFATTLYEYFPVSKGFVIATLMAPSASAVVMNIDKGSCGV